MLEVRNISKVKSVSKSFGGDIALKNCSFKVSEGSIVGVVGANGSGKTTLFNAISGIIKIDSGRIYFCGKDITDKSIECRSNLGIARSFQDTKLFENLSVRENILLAMDNEDTYFFKNLFGRVKVDKKKLEEVKALLKMIDFADLEHRQVRDLSWGQKKLIEFLRAIARPHKLLLFDEPAAGIIPIYRQEKLGNALEKLKARGETILLIDHDLDFTFKFSDKIIYLSEGAVTATGPPDQIRKNRKVIDDYIGK